MKKYKQFMVRKALWHFRMGGPRQLRTYLLRNFSRSSDEAPVNVSSRTGRDGPVVRSWPTQLPESRLPEIRVGVILDEFSTFAFKYEWQQIPLKRDRWLDQVSQNKIDLLFVESAWNGNSGSWKYHLTGSKAPSKDLLELVTYCKESGIPTVFWNKEDPIHFEEFIDTAEIFDFVYTTESSMIDEYKKRLNHSNIAILPFGAQHSVHNPVRLFRDFHTRDVAFGGMYFTHRHEDRRLQMDMLLGAAHEVSPRLNTGLEIYSRFHGKDERYQFPKPLIDHVVGSLDYEEMLNAYRLHKVFLNVNTVVGSTSMCARRIFEITACGTPVISTPSPAISKYFGNDVVVEVDTKSEARDSIRALVRNENLRKRLVHKGQRIIWKNHTYEHRARTILLNAGIQVPASDESISMITSTNRPHQLEHVMETIARQADVNLEAIVGTHGFTIPSKQQSKLIAMAGSRPVRFINLHKDLTLGECLNSLVAEAKNKYIAKIDDDDYYGSSYLFDQLQSMRYSGADLVGKGAHYVFDADTNTLMLKNPQLEHRFHHFVAGPTIFTTRELLAEFPFEARSRGEDTALLNTLLENGKKIYSSDIFGFSMHRRSKVDDSEHRHTWTVGSWQLLANSEVITHGYNLEHVEVE